MHILKEKPFSNAVEFLPNSIQTEKIDELTKNKRDLEVAVHKIQMEIDSLEEDYAVLSNIQDTMQMFITKYPAVLGSKYFCLNDSGYWCYKVPNSIHTISPNGESGVIIVQDDLKAFLETQCKSLIEQRNEIISKLANQHSKDQFLPSFSEVRVFGHKIYIFPRLLIIYSAFAFFLGFFIEVAFQTKVFKEPM